MYNRYIGNTGRYIRVEDGPAHSRGGPDPNPRSRGQSGYPLGGNPQGGNPAGPGPGRSGPETGRSGHSPPPGPPARRSPLPFGGLKNLFGGLGGSGGSLFGGGSGLFGGGGGLKGMLDHLPFGLDIGDLLLLGLLLLFFVDSHDEEFLIILGIFAFSIYKDSKNSSP